MSTLHERLLAAIEEPAAGRQEFYVRTAAVERFGAALRAVVERHVPIEHRVFGTLCGECSVLESGQGWDDVLRFVAEPCPTIQAIAEALGIGETPK